jgi:anti-sigma factor RsiW
MTHLSCETLTGYLDADLPDEEKREAELHLVSCTECREELLAVRQLQVRHRRRWKLALIPFAAAAAVLAAIALPRHPTAPSEVRGRPGAEPAIGIVSPAPWSTVAPGPIVFTWRSAGPEASYTFTLQAADGRVAWTSTLVDTVAVLPDSVSLRPGLTWFWMVEALLADGQSRSSGLNRLSIQE